MKKILFALLVTVMSLGSCIERPKFLKSKIQQSQIVDYSVSLIEKTLTGGDTETFLQSMKEKFITDINIDTAVVDENYGDIFTKTYRFPEKDGMMNVSISVLSGLGGRTKISSITLMPSNVNQFPLDWVFHRIEDGILKKGIVKSVRNGGSSKFNFKSNVKNTHWDSKISFIHKTKDGNFSIIGIESYYSDELLNVTEEPEPKTSYNSLYEQQENNEDLLTHFISGKVTSIDGYVNIRNGKGTNHEIIGTISVGEDFTYEDSSENWVLVQKGSIKGYVHKSGISKK